MRELSLNVMDVAQNSISAKADRITITVEEREADHTLVISIEDNGCGMTEEQVAQVQSPFYTTRTTRPVGLGVPLFKMASEMTGGAFSIQSQPGKGTAVRAQFQADHIDMTPLGDMCESIVLLISCNPQLDFLYRRTRAVAGESAPREFVLDTRDVRGILGDDVSLSHPDVVAWIRDFIREGEASLDNS